MYSSEDGGIHGSAAKCIVVRWWDTREYSQVYSSEDGGIHGSTAKCIVVRWWDSW